jgi:hypothetical protein
MVPRVDRIASAAVNAISTKYRLPAVAAMQHLR